MRGLFLLISSFFSIGLLATTIIPFENLGELKLHATLVVYVEGMGDFEVNESISTSYNHKFEIIEMIKGEYLSKELVVPYKRKKIGEMESIIAGENEFKKGERYLLFLSNVNGEFQTICMSYYVFTEKNHDSNSYFIPSHIIDTKIIGHKPTEKLSVFNKDVLIEKLSHYRSGQKWDSRAYIAEKKYQSMYLKELKMLPSHCSQFTFGGNPFRWKNNENSSLPVYYQSVGSECPNISDEMSDAINHITSNYKGVNMNLAGTFSGYSTNCNSNNDPVDVNNEFGSFIGGSYGTDQIVLVQFSDPCNEISPLVSCSGTLAYGGSWVSSNTHSYNGTTWANQIYGYVVVNESAGNCLCGQTGGGNSISDYSILMAHELTHVLGFEHITSGTANMNPFCCNEITNLDIQCLNNNYLPVAEVPGCTDTNAHNYDPSATLDNGSCETCNDGLLNGDEVDVDCGGVLCPDCPCTDVGDIALKNINLSVNDIIRSSGMLTLDTVMVLNPASVFWQSQQSILLNPEFSVELGSELILSVDDCAIPN